MGRIFFFLFLWLRMRNMHLVLCLKDLPVTWVNNGKALIVHFQKHWSRDSWILASELTGGHFLRKVSSPTPISDSVGLGKSPNVCSLLFLLVPQQCHRRCVDRSLFLTKLWSGSTEFPPWRELILALSSSPIGCSSTKNPAKPKSSTPDK